MGCRQQEREEGQAGRMGGQGAPYLFPLSLPPLLLPPQCLHVLQPPLLLLLLQLALLPLPPLLLWAKREVGSEGSRDLGGGPDSANIPAQV